jgi:outer membrane lipoprotein-sorting protein
MHVRQLSLVVSFMAVMISFFPYHAKSQNKPMNAASVEALKGHVKELAHKTQTITSDFIQEKNMAMITEKIISRGKFYFKKEKMLRWEYVDPFSYLIIIRNDQISVKDEYKVTHFNVKSNKVFLEINRIILGSLQGTLLNDETNFTPAFLENPTSYIVTLKPLTQKLKESIAEIVIHFDRKDVTVNRVEMFEPGGDRTRINFTNKKFNQPISDEKFVAR